MSLPKFDRSVSCLCWAYNEKFLIRDFIRRMDDLLKSTVEDYEIVVVDDGSTDGTREVLRSVSAENQRILLYENERNLNVGHCFRRAIKVARKEFLFWQTVDWSYDLENLRLYLELLKEFDVVAGSRLAPIPRTFSFWDKVRLYLKVLSFSHLRTRSDTILKAIVSVTNYVLVRLLFGIPLTDYQNLSIYPTALIQSFPYESASSFANPEGLIRAYWQGARIAEVPIRFIPRGAGLGKGTRPKAIWKSVSNILSLWWSWKILRRFDHRVRGTVSRPGLQELKQRHQQLEEEVIASSEATKQSRWRDGVASALRASQ